MSAIARPSAPVSVAPESTLRLIAEPSAPNRSAAATSSSASRPHTYRPLPPLDPDAPPSPRSTPISLTALQFNPPEEIAAQIIQDLCRPDSSLCEIADRASTTIEGLTLWMSRPDIAARLDAFEAGAARHLRMAVTNTMQAVVSALGRIVREFHESESDVGQTVTPATPTAIALASCRNRNTFIEVVKSLLRIYTAHAPRPIVRRGIGLPADVSGASPEVAPRPPTRSAPRQ